MIPKYLTIRNGSVIMKQTDVTEEKQIESKFEVITYLDRLKYALQTDHARIQFQQTRHVDQRRNEKFTNRYTVSKLFPQEDPVEALKRELLLLDVADYIETVKDTRYTQRSEMRVFGKKYSGEDVFIKIRVELFKASAAGTENAVFVMSFHYAEEDFVESDFPYAGK